ncbi:MAG: glycosyl hydrolase, partial [Planctomycetota bacterium]
MREHRMVRYRLLLFLATSICASLVVRAFADEATNAARAGDGDWPPLTAECRPWAYWWWMGSAVDRADLTTEMEAYAAAGMGGFHIVPIYGVKGWEDRYVEYLSPKWMSLMGHAVGEARRLGMDCDMSLSTGWCFGGPWIADANANARVKHSVHLLQSGKPMDKRFDPSVHQAIVAFGPEGEIVDDLKHRIGPDGLVDWIVPDGEWTLYVVWQEPSGRKVKRAAPGGEGWMVNPLSRRAIDAHLAAFTEAFDAHEGPLPRAIYHDSYEYQCDWAPELFDEFARRRGYRLEHYLPALFGKGQADVADRVLCDVRETFSDVHLECFTEPYVDWAHGRGMIVRNEAHGSP